MSRSTIVALAVWATVMLACLTLAYCQWQRAGTAATEAKLNRSQGGAAIESGRDAVTVIGGRSDQDAAADAATKENEDEIRKAEGAAAPVATPVRDSGLRGLCRRAAHRGDPRCVQFANP